MHSLYTSALEKRCRRFARLSLLLACAPVVCGWAVCAYLCTRVRTGNAAALFPPVLILATLSGWAAILIFFLAYRPARAEYRHVAGILREAPSDLREGTLTWVGDAFQLPGSIRVRKANLENGSETASLLLDERLAKGIPQGTPLRIRTRRKFLSDYEVLP